MAEKRILIANADVKTWEEFRFALGKDWIVVGAATGDAALAETQKESFDAIVASDTLPGMDGVELLNRVRATNPRTLRFIAAPETHREEISRHAHGGHRFLAVPFERATIKSSIERSLLEDYGMSQSMRDLVGRIRTFPTIPSLYLEVVNALKDPNATTGDIGAIIAKDMAMTTRLVQVINSAYFGLPRTITDPTEAVGILGFETVKSLIIAVKLLSQYDKVKPVYFSIDHVWRHSTQVARTAKALALLETGDAECSGTAYTAGLMHDLGKVILAANFDDQYHGAHVLARKLPMPLWEVEKDIFGVSHGEIGAYLLGLWSMSAEVVQVAALHHHPLRAGDKTFTPLTAVHVANALEYERNASSNGLPPPVVDAAYLEQLGLGMRLDLWREVQRNPEETKFETKTQRAKSAAKAAARPVSRPAAKAATRSVNPAPAPQPNKSVPVEWLPAAAPSPFRGLWKWAGFGLGVSVALALLARLEIVRLENRDGKPVVEEAAETTPPTVKYEMALAGTPAGPVQEAGPAPVPPTQAAPEMAAQPPPAPGKTAFDELKLQAIFFNTQHPAALISGTLARVDQEIADCRVLEISPSTVTLEYQHQRKTLTLR